MYLNKTHCMTKAACSCLRTHITHVKLSSVSNRAFLVAVSCVWNKLPSEVTSAQSLHSFRRHLKTFLFQRSFPDVIMTL